MNKSLRRSGREYVSVETVSMIKIFKEDLWV